jgi:hypothetical protein
MNAAGPAVQNGDILLAHEKFCDTKLLSRSLIGRPSVSISALHGWSVE